MKLTIIGPNIPGNQGQPFHVHATGCADLCQPKYRYAGHERQESEYETFQDLVEDYYADIIAENEGTDREDWEVYESEFKVFPCARGRWPYRRDED